MPATDEARAGIVLEILKRLRKRNEEEADKEEETKGQGDNQGDTRDTGVTRIVVVGD